MDWLWIEDGWIGISWGVNGVSMPMWFAVPAIAVVLVSMILSVVLLAAMSSKRREGNRE
jgi:hypothetical protein